jgi:ribonuclease T1
VKRLLGGLVAIVLATGAAAFSPLGEIAVGELPPQARDTIALIHRGGPFPYASDGSVFHNREALLPARSRGYYREYTVKTPGARDRGARRIVGGRAGELYYSGDHYRSFKRIRE